MKNVIQIVLAVAAWCMVAVAVADAQQIVWIESTLGAPALRRATTDGSAVTSVAMPAGKLPQGVAIDNSTNTLYVAEALYYGGTLPDAHLQRWPLGFTGSTAYDSLPNTGGESSFRGVAVDGEAGHLYWTSTRADEGCRIRRANLDGSNELLLIQFTVGDATNLRGIAIDHGGGKMYWCDGGTGTIKKANLDGTSIETVVTSDPLNGLNGIALDLTNGRLYWVEQFSGAGTGQGTIRRSNLDGSAAVTILSGLGSPLWIALNVPGNAIYWTEAGLPGTAKVQKANLDGSVVVDLSPVIAASSGSAVSNPQGIVVQSCTPASVTLHPTNQNVCAGTLAIFTASGTGSPAPMVQWQQSTDNGVSWSDIPGETSPTLDFICTDTDNGRQYHAVFTNSCGSPATSSNATLTLKPASIAPVGITKSSDNNCPSSLVTLTPTGGSKGTGASYKWYAEAACTSLLHTGDTYDVTPSITTSYWVRLEGECGPPTSTATTTVTVKTYSTAPSAITKSSDNNCASTLVTLTPTGGSKGTGASYKWYAEAACTSLLHTGDTYDVTPSITTSYWVRLEGDCGPPTATAGTTVLVDDVDGDGICGTVDNCPTTSNPGQEDADLDGMGDACDPMLNIDGFVGVTVTYIQNLPLNNGLQNSLTGKLLDAQEKYCLGQIVPATNKVNAFINQVQSLQASSVLTATAANYLIGQAQVLLAAMNTNSVECPPAAKVGADVPIEAGDLFTMMNVEIHPNPFHVRAYISFTAIEDNIVTVDVFDHAGKQIRRVFDQSVLHGQSYMIQFAEHNLPQGVYYFRVSSGNRAQTGRIIHLPR